MITLSASSNNHKTLMTTGKAALRCWWMRKTPSIKRFWVNHALLKLLDPYEQTERCDRQREDSKAFHIAVYQGIQAKTNTTSGLQCKRSTGTFMWPEHYEIMHRVTSYRFYRFIFHWGPLRVVSYFTWKDTAVAKMIRTLVFSPAKSGFTSIISIVYCSVSV